MLSNPFDVRHLDCMVMVGHTVHENYPIFNYVYLGKIYWAHNSVVLHIHIITHIAWELHTLLLFGHWTSALEKLGVKCLTQWYLSGSYWGRGQCFSFTFLTQNSPRDPGIWTEDFLKLLPPNLEMQISNWIVCAESLILSKLFKAPIVPLYMFP